LWRGAGFGSVELDPFCFLYYHCIDKPIPTRIDGETNSYICLTCVTHMKKQKMPPMSIKNGLQLSETHKEIKDQNLQLTELDGALIAKNIIFQKIYQLSKSRWTALKDRVPPMSIKNKPSVIVKQTKK
jgi:hypothetical protein